MQLERYNTYQHLTEFDLQSITDKQIFFDPPDTEISCWVGHDLITNCDAPPIVLDLGSGSGATIASFLRSGASTGIGLDISQDSLKWAKDHYTQRNQRAQFFFYDFLKSEARKLDDILRGEGAPQIVTSNPPYVPMRADLSDRFRTIDGGEDGLKFFLPALQYALRYNSDFGFTLGSYSCLKKFMETLNESSYEIFSITLSYLPFSGPTFDNFSQVEKLIEEGEALVWKNQKGEVEGYVIVGIAAKRSQNRLKDNPVQLFDIVGTACSSKTPSLEALDDISDNLGVILRVLELPLPESREHW